MDNAKIAEGFAGLDLFVEREFPGLTVPIEERRGPLNLTGTEPGVVRYGSYRLSFPPKEITLDRQKIGAITGVLCDSRGNEKLNWFQKFGVTPRVCVFDFSGESFDLRHSLELIRIHMWEHLCGEMMDGIFALCSPRFYRALRQTLNSVLLSPDPQWESGDFDDIVQFMGITFEMDEERRIADGVAQFFPLGTKETFQIWRVPPRYQQLALADAFAMCLRPELLVQGVMA